jgi:hypothetical protein
MYTLSSTSLFRSRFMITFTLCFMPSKVHGWRTFSKCRLKLSYHLVLGPLYWECAHHEALAYITCHVIFLQTPPFVFGHVPQKNSSLWDVSNWKTWFWDMPKHIRTCLHNIRHLSNYIAIDTQLFKIYHVFSHIEKIKSQIM